MTRSSLFLAALAALPALAGCGPDCGPRGGDPRPNVVLVTVDTLRADHLGTYGGTAAPTPRLDGLAREGTVFEHAFAQSHVTVPSHVSIMTSLPVSAHGVSTNNERLVRRPPHLAALFRAAGWRTGAFVGARHLGPGWALGDLVRDGFETFEMPERLSKPRRATETTDRAARWIRAACREPLFVWVHYWDPHTPYDPPEPWRSRLAPDPRTVAASEPLRDADPGWVARDPSALRAALGRCAAEVRALKRDFGLTTRRVRQLIEVPAGTAVAAIDPGDRRGLTGRLQRLGRRVRDRLPYRDPGFAFLNGVERAAVPRGLYAGEVAYTDDEIGRLVDAVAGLGIAARTVVAVVADHGESLGEHGVWWGHVGVYEPNLRIPMILWSPGRVPAARRTEPVDTLDLPPTLLRLAGLAPAPGMRGRDLLAAAPLPERTLVAEAPKGTQQALRAGGWKLIRNAGDVWHADSFARAAGTRELYDLDADPSEAHDRAVDDPARAGALDAALSAWLAEARVPDAQAPIPPDRARALEALGYLE